MSELEDLVVLVTGCSSGIGRSLAVEFARRGHRTFASARRAESIADLVQPKLTPIPLDVASHQSISSAVNRVVDAEGRIDLLVNNAGVNLFGPLAELPIDETRQLFETNVLGALALIQAVVPHMVRRREGRIVNVGSVVGVLPTPFAGAYCASKAALHMLSDVLRMELKPFGIEVIVVQPGGVRSNIAKAGAVGLERYAAETSLYARVYRQIEKRANASQDRPMDTEEFARRLVDAVTRRHAPRTVRSGRGARSLSALGRLPGSVIDRMMSRRFGLARLSERNRD